MANERDEGKGERWRQEARGKGEARRALQAKSIGRVGGDIITCDNRARGLALWVTRSDSELNARSTLTPVPKNAVAITSHILPWPSALFITDHRKRNKTKPM